MSGKLLRAAVTGLWAMAAWSGAGQPAGAAVPKLSGIYATHFVKNCGSGIVGLASGTWTFTGADWNYSLEYNDGAPTSTLTVATSSGTFTNTATTVTLGSTLYHATYGKLSNGTATFAELIGVAGSGDTACIVQITLTLT